MSAAVEPIVRRPAGVRAPGWLRTVDHKEIGVLYIAMGLGFLIVGGVEALVMRWQLAAPEQHVVDPELYSQLFTMHGITMIFLAAIPLLVGLANFIVPLQIGARDVAFPRLNALSFWLSLLGGLLLYFSFVAGGAPDAGWFAYVPLSDRAFSIGTGLDYYALGLAVNGAGTIVGALNLIVTIALLRAPGMSIGRIPLFTWMVLVTSVLIIGAYPALSADLVLLLVDRYLGAHFFTPGSGGDALIWQHLFWFFGHPEVYVVILPAFGMISEVIPVFSGKPIFGYRFVAASSVAIGFLSFGVWAHHMFAVGLGDEANGFFSAASMLIAIPTGVKMFNWIATMIGGRLRFTTAMLFAVGFLSVFVLGGLTGVTLGTVPLDLMVTQSYYVVAHFHYTLVGGVVLAIFAGSYYWFPKISGRLLSERLGRWHFWLVYIGFNLTFLPQYLLGLEGMARRIWTYPATTGWGTLNLVSSVGAAIMALGIAVFAWNVVVSLRAGAIAGDDPWDAWTLEWTTTSPPPPENFESTPVVTSRRPLWDRKHPDLAGPVVSAAAATVSPATPALSRPPLLGVALFIASESIFFLGIIFAFVQVRPADVTAAKAQLDLGRTAFFSVCLFASSATITLSHRGGARHRGWLALTWILGAVFLVGQGSEYARLLRSGLAPATGIFETAFFTLTGLHGLHVLVGLIAIGGLFLVASRRPGGLGGVAWEGVTWYWHFVDAVWVVVFGVVYLWTAAS